MKINDKIRTLREIKNLTQENMANQLHMSTNGYANIERGETKINTDKLEKIAHILNLSPVELMSFGEKNSVFVYGAGDNATNGSFNVMSSSGGDEFIHEISKQQLIIKHQLETIEHQKQEIAQLKEIIELLKAQNS